MWYCSPTSSLVAIISRSRRMTIPNAVVTPTENRLEVPKKEKGMLVYSALQMDGMEGGDEVMVTRSSEIKVKERVKGVKEREYVQKEFGKNMKKQDKKDRDQKLRKKDAYRYCSFSNVSMVMVRGSP